MLHIQLICVGGLKEDFYKKAAAEYIKRLAPYVKIEVREIGERPLPPDPPETLVKAALAEEGQLIHRALTKDAYCAALCVEGESITSEGLAALLTRLGNEGRSKICFILGGSRGIDEGFKLEADRRISMSAMTFPHHLARVMLLEQLYRACMIETGADYHK